MPLICENLLDQNPYLRTVILYLNPAALVLWPHCV